MVETGDEAPDFTAPLANGDVETFTLSDHLDEAPIVLAFFPGAFTSTCSSEMAALEERLSAFDDAGARVLGVSVDTPFASNEFRDQLDLSFGLVGDSNREVVEAWDASTDFDDVGVYDVAKRSVYVVDESGTVTYAWEAPDPGVEPDYDAVLEAVQEAG